MKAPSPICLHALRQITFSLPPTQYIFTSQRCYSSAPPKQPPPPSTGRPPISQPPAPQPGFRLRQKPDDDEDHTPVPLTRPIGMPYPPLPGQNTGIDSRDLRTRRDDFVDYEKHLQKRAKMTKQISKPYFRDWSNLRFHKGKVFVAPPRLFKAETALWFPNFFGRTLRKGAERRNMKDGYRGLGRDTMAVMKGAVSVVCLYTSDWGMNQCRSWGVDELSARIRVIKDKEGLKDGREPVQVVHINYEDNLLRYWIWRLFGLRRLRKEFSTPAEQDRYFMVRRGFSEEMKEALGFMNEKAGYVYLVDANCRIRWAGSAEATPEEKKGLTRGIQKLLGDSKMQREILKRSYFQDLDGEIAKKGEEEEQKASASG